MWAFRYGGRVNGCAVDGCAVDGCGRRIHAGGVCARHYQRFKRHGSYEALRTARPAGQTPEEAFRWFMPGVPPEVPGLAGEMQPCWDWCGPRMNAGYGVIRYNAGRVRFLAHRVSYQIFVGVIPENLNVLHSCDRPVCVQPGHLRVGGQVDNVRDAMDRGRWDPAHPNHARGESHGLAKLTEDQVRFIRARVFTQRELASLLGISRSTVRQVQSGRTWRHVY